MSGGMVGANVLRIKFYNFSGVKEYFCIDFTNKLSNRGKISIPLSIEAIKCPSTSKHKLLN